MSRSRPGRSAGLTLIELLAALSVTGLALAAGSVALGSLLKQRARVAAVTAAPLEALAVRRELTALIATARLLPGQDGVGFQGMDAEFRGLPDDDLRFLADGPTPLGGAAIVRLYVSRDPGSTERGLVAELWEWGGLGSARLEIEPRVGGLEVRYLTAITGRSEWMPGWISSWALPQAVELRLIAQPPDTLPALLRLPITVPLAAGR